MTIKSCSECSGKVSSRAAACPHCGSPCSQETGSTPPQSDTAPQWWAQALDSGGTASRFSPPGDVPSHILRNEPRRRSIWIWICASWSPFVLGSVVWLVYCGWMAEAVNRGFVEDLRSGHLSLIDRVVTQQILKNGGATIWSIASGILWVPLSLAAVGVIATIVVCLVSMATRD